MYRFIVKVTVLTIIKDQPASSIAHPTPPSSSDSFSCKKKVACGCSPSSSSVLSPIHSPSSPSPGPPSTQRGKLEMRSNPLSSRGEMASTHTR